MRFVLGVVLMLLAAPVVADEAGPTTIYGIPVGSPHGMMACSDHTPSPEESPCWRKRYAYPESVDIYVASTPLGLRSRVAKADVVDGKVERLVLETEGVATQKLLVSQLVAKFGAPHGHHVTEQVTGAGQVVDVVGADWAWDDLDVTFRGATGRIDRGEIVVQTKRGAQLDADRQRAREEREPRM